MRIFSPGLSSQPARTEPDVAGELDAAVADDGDGAFEGLAGVVDGGELGDAHAADDAGGADGTGADADLDGVGAGVAQGDGGLAGGDVAGDDVDVGVMLGDPAHHVHDAFGVAVGGIDDHDVHLLLRQALHAPVIARAAGDGGRDAQAVLGVAVVGGVLVLDELLHVGEGVEPGEAAVFVHQRQFADFVCAHDFVGLFQRGAGGGGDGGLGHDGREFLAAAVGIAQILAGDHAHQAILVVEDGEAAELEAAAALFGQQVGHFVVGVEADGALDEAVEVVLDAGDLRGLLFLVQVFVDAADAAGQGHRDGHRRLGHRVHRRGHEGDVHLLAAGQARLQACVVRQKVRVLCHQRHVVVRQTFEGELRHEAIQVFVLHP